MNNFVLGVLCQTQDYSIFGHNLSSGLLDTKCNPGSDNYHILDNTIFVLGWNYSVLIQNPIVLTKQW